MAKITQPGKQNIVVELNDYRSEMGIGAIALLEKIGKTFSVKKVMRSFSSYRQMYRVFNWILEWTPTSSK